MLDVKKYKLKTLSPVHIGNGNVYNSLEFVVFGKKVYFVSEEKMAEQLPAEVIDDFTRGIIAGNYNSLFEFLWKKNLCKEDILTKISTYVVSSDSVNENVREIREFVKEQKNYPYIPGSSIKGMFRTAFLYKALENHKDFLYEILDKKLEDFYADSNRDKGWFKRNFAKSMARKIENELLNRFKLNYNIIKFDPHTDIFRCFKVSDSSLLTMDAITIYEIKVFSYGKGEKYFSIYAECLKPGSSVEFTISIDRFLFDRFTDTGKGRFSKEVLALFGNFLNNPTSFLEDFTLDLLKIEAEFCLKCGLPPPKINTKNSIGRLGFGSGLLGVTIDMLLDKKRLKKVRDSFGAKRNEERLVPKSRRIENKTKSILGIVEICEE
ncbi:MAG: type III-A CRISPR-associated RAMP protein Csm5 [Candidatus Cloacimonas sp. 4484_209]|nr:MAG: type III-A CRISPR-associated RAMP protein Csm5 [Candidatus Cloacimonas sp. 4484_209]